MNRGNRDERIKKKKKRSTRSNFEVIFIGAALNLIDLFI